MMKSVNIGVLTHYIFQSTWYRLALDGLATRLVEYGPWLINLYGDVDNKKVY